MKTLLGKMGLFIIMISLVSSVPATAVAETIVFTPQTERELMAYMYGRISQLQELKGMLENTASGASSCSPTSFNVSAETMRASEINVTDAVLRGEVWLYNDATAKAWFEYGEDEDFLDQRTRQVSIRSAYDRAVRVKVGSLFEDERYYFRIVVQEKSGVVLYGDTRGFRTDESDD